MSQLKRRSPKVVRVLHVRSTARLRAYLTESKQVLIPLASCRLPDPQRGPAQHVLGQPRPYEACGFHAGFMHPRGSVSVSMVLRTRGSTIPFTCRYSLRAATRGFDAYRLGGVFAADPLVRQGCGRCQPDRPQSARPVEVATAYTLLAIAEHRLIKRVYRRDGLRLNGSAKAYAQIRGGVPRLAAGRGPRDITECVLTRRGNTG
jgi:hypothetical protein